MRRFAVVGIAAVIVVWFGYPRSFINSALASNVRKSAAAPSSHLIQLYRAVEIARPLHQSQNHGPAIAKISARVNTPGLQAIAGTVTTGDGTPLSRIKAIVIAYTADSSSTPSKGFAYVNPDGSYLIENLLPGNFYVVAQADDYEAQYYHQAATIEKARWVYVADADTTAGIDFKLQKIAPGTGVIAGKVTNAAGLPIANASVSAYSKDSPFTFANAATARDGTYRLEALKTGSYIVQVWADGYLTEFYDNARSSVNAKLVAVNEPNETPNIDFVLNAGGMIAGKVSDQEGNPIMAAIIQGYFAKPDSSADKGFGIALTEKDGTYKISGLASGDYIISAEAWTPWAYAKRWHKNVGTPDSATAIAVKEEQSIANIDFILDLPRLAGAISGAVTDLKGDPLPEASVQAYSWAGGADSLSLKPRFWIYAQTDSAGRYRLEAPAGNYIVSASAYNGWQYAERWYPNVSTPDSARPLAVRKNIELQFIDFKLPIVKGNSVIYGKVMADDGRPLAGAFIEVTPADDPAKPLWKVWANASTDSFGQYYIGKLPAGKYIVHAQYWEDIRFGEQWHQNAGAREAATPVEVKESEKVGSIDFKLKLRPRYGSIFGRVTSEADGAPISRAYVEVSPLKRDYCSGAPIAFWNWNATTNERGEYRLELLPEGEYLLSVHANGAFEYFENAVVPEQATLIKVIGGDSVKAHFGLTPRNEGNGVISGSVTGEFNDSLIPLAIVIARPTIVPLVWPQSEMFFTAVTNPDGSYKMTGLPSGEYYVLSFAPGYIGEFYDNVFDPAEARVVHVDQQKPTPNINFTLQQIYYRLKDGVDPRAGNGVSVIGKVSAAGKKGVANAYVYVLNDNRQPVAFGRTNSEGFYEITGVAAGKYRLLASHTAFNSKYNDDANRFAEAKPADLSLGKIEINFVLDPKTITGIDDQMNAAIPQTVELYGNYPNPFNPETQIAFGLPATMRVKIRIFNLLGEEVAVLHDGVLNAGVHRLNWNGRSKVGRESSTGLYLYRLESATVTLRGKMLLMR